MRGNKAERGATGETAPKRGPRRILHLASPSIEQQALRSILATDLPDVLVVSVFSLSEALDALQDGPAPDLLLFLDTALEVEGRTLIAAARAARPEMAIAAYGRFGLADCQRWLAAGCDALIARDLPPVRFIDAVDMALAGHRSVSRELVMEPLGGESGCAFLATCGWGHPLLEKMPAALLLIQGERFIYANRAATQLLGYEMKELLDLRCGEVIADRHRDFFRARLERWQRGQGPAGMDAEPGLILAATHKNGGLVWLDLQATLANVGGVPTVICTATNLTRHFQETEPQGLLDLSPLDLARLDLAPRSPATAEADAPANNIAAGSSLMLTRRQYQVLHQISSGATNKQIADRLGISEATAKLHVHRTLRALRVASRAEAALIGRTLGLLP
jgi:PAS domain S-box-containing protein